MERLKVALIALMVNLLGCAGVGASNASGISIPSAELSLEGEEVGALDCDLCRRGHAGENLWCDECGVGFIGGEKVVGEACFSCKSEGIEHCAQCENGFTEPEASAVQGSGQGFDHEKASCEGES